MGKPEGVPSHPTPGFDAEHPGYETQDVNVKGIVVFLGGLLLSVAVFFGLCFFLGKAINGAFVKADGAPDQWHQYGAVRNTDRQNLVDNPVLQQKVAGEIAKSFPTPQLDTDDGNQATADLHAREDLLLNYYSTDKGNTRIPIGVAMALIAQRGLGAAPAASTTTLMAGDSKPEIHAPLTSGFARTGYELDTIEKREQQNQYKAAERAHEAEEKEHKK